MSFWIFSSLCLELLGCFDPDEVRDAEYSFNPSGKNRNGEYRHGTTAEVKCDRGFQLDGRNNKLKCVDGDWEGELSYCQGAF